MSALTDLFSAMATKIRSKTGTQTTYTPSEMVSGGIDDVYDAGVAAGGTSTPITPSNSSPASMTSGTKYTPSTNGYAIASYDSVTPSSTPESVASGDIVKIGGSGVIVDAIPTPTSITPSNSSPVALTADTPVNPTSGGYAIASYSSVTPSNDGDLVSSGDIVKFGGSGVVVDDIEGINPSDSSPVTLYMGHYYGMGDSGYAIASYSTATPSNSSPAYVEGGKIYKIGGNLTGYVIDHYNTLVPSNSSPAVISSGDMRKVNANGYAIESYTSVTPSSTQTAVSSGDIVKIGGNGVIVDTVPPTPTSITPSNSNPVPMYANTAYEPTVNGIAIADFINAVPSNSSPQSLVSGNIYKSQGNGYGIASYNSITPSNSTPVSLTSGEFYKPSASGYAISSYSSKTPSDTSPASVSSGAIIKASSAGYLVKNTPVNLGAPDVISQANMSGNTSRNITVTKTPRYIIFILVRANDTSGRNYCTCYDVGKDTYTYEYYGGDGYAKTETASGKPSLITTVSSTTVTVNNTVASTCRSHVLIYY